MKKHKLNLENKRYLQKTLEKNIKLFDENDWEKVSIYQKLSESFIEKHSNKVDWYWISGYQDLSEKFIEKYSDKVYWGWICKYQNLSEQFIEKYSDKVEWWYISEFQVLSLNFIIKNIDKVCLDYAIDNSKISLETKKQIKKIMKKLSLIDTYTRNKIKQFNPKDLDKNLNLLIKSIKGK